VYWLCPRHHTGEKTSEYARSLIEASLDPLVTVNPDGKITDVNEASVNATGVPRKKLIGTDFSDYFTKPQKAKEGYKLVFAKGFVSDYPLTLRNKNGKLIEVLFNASVYRDEKEVCWEPLRQRVTSQFETDGRKNPKNTSLYTIID